VAEIHDYVLTQYQESLKTIEQMRKEITMLRVENELLHESLEAQGNWWQCKKCGHWSPDGLLCLSCGYDPTG